MGLFQKPNRNYFQGSNAGEAAETVQARQPAEVEQSGANPAPTRAPLQTRSASPSNYNTSGMETAMGALADKIHKPRR